MKNTFALLLTVLVLASCASRKPQISKTVNVKDSVSVTVTTKPRDTAIVIKGEDVQIRANVNELTAVPVQKKNIHNTVSLSKVGDDIIADCHTEDYQKIIAIQDKIIQYYRSHAVDTTENTTISEPFVPQLVKILAWFGGIMFVLIIVYCCWKLFRKTTNPLSL